MKIIVSPSKTQYSQATISLSDKLLVNPDLTLKLFQKMKKMSKSMIGKLMKIDGNLLNETYDLYQNFKSSLPMIRAMDCYQGVVFQEIKIDQYNAMQRDYMNQHLVILSAMYGVLEPDTPIWPYRLDLTMRPSGVNLYKYWQQTIDQYFAKEEIILNLASEEFTKWLQPHQEKIVHLHFRDRKADGELKVISYNAKQARGCMAHHLITEHITHIHDIKRTVIAGYTYEAELSDERNYFFVKPFVRKKQIKQ